VIEQHFREKPTVSEISFGKVKVTLEYRSLDTGCEGVS